ncbi:MAG: single-stranded DNA-binding protein [Candidatus Paceibacterota bacterium]|jgi:single-strand DNA-binding protein
MYLNKVLLYGNMTKDPEVKALPSGIKVASFSLATNRTFKDKNGVKQEKVDFHNIVVFGKQAELIEQYMKKGNPIYVEGRIENRSWEGADGKKNYRTEIIVDSFQFGPKTAGGATGGSYAPKTDAAAPKKESAKDSGSEIQYPDEEINIEDIPF